MEIRQIEPADAKKFVEFYEELAGETDYLMFTPAEVSAKAADEADFIKKYDDYRQVFIALENDKIVGYLGISRSHLTKLSRTAKFTVGVLNEHQRQGIATKLISFAEKWAKDNGVTKLELKVITENEPAIALFEKTGFEKEGTRKKSVNINDEYYDELFMGKEI